MEKVYVKDNIVVSEIKEYLKPEYIYLEVNSDLLVNDGYYVRKGDPITKDICSPISGIVRKIVYKKNIKDNITKYLVIENDYKEKMSRINKKRILSIPSGMKYILVNGIDEIYISNKRSIIDRYSSLLLETIDNGANGVERVYICLSNSDSNSYEKISNYIKRYPNMEIIRIDDFYLNNDNMILKKEVFGYDKEKVFIIDIMDLYEFINKNSCNIVITVGGSNINNSGCIKIKEGTLLSDIINYLGGYKDRENISITVNGVLGGTIIKDDDIVVNRNIKSVFITNKVFNKEHLCINCGKCYKVCPVNLVPVYIMNNRLKKERLKKFNISKCTECGICSFVCPSNINLKEYIKIAKESIKDE